MQGAQAALFQCCVNAFSYVLSFMLRVLQQNLFLTCSLRSHVCTDVVFVAALCWLVPAFAAQCTALAQLQRELGGDVVQLKGN